MTAPRVAGGVLALLSVAAAPALASREVWVVDENSRDVRIIAADTEVVTGTISLTDILAAPRDIAFSSVAGHVGRYAFVTQGSFVRVIDTLTRAVFRTVNVASFLGRPAVLRGCSSARPRNFLGTGGVPVVKNYLHVAAQVQPPSGPTEPWFIVLDQQALVAAPPGPPPIVAAGALLSGVDGVTREAMDVVVLGEEHGPQFQRAWYTFREDTPNPTLFAAQLVTARPLGSPWGVAKLRPETFAPGTLLPTNVGVAAPFSRELPELPLGPHGQLVNLDTAHSCSPGGVLQDVAVTGPGPTAYTVLVADRVAPAASGIVHQIDERTCTDQMRTVGQNPVDIAILDPIDWRKAFVANLDSDTVTVLRSDGSWNTVPVGDGPRSLESNFPEIGCTIRALDVDPSDPDTVLTWTPDECASPSIAFKVWCHCAEDCPIECRDLSLAPADGDGKWGPLGVVVENVFTHVDAMPLGSITYSIEPCAIGEYQCDP